MTGRIRHLPVCSFQPLRTYSTNFTLHQIVSPDLRSSNTPDQHSRKGLKLYRPLIQGRLPRDFSFAQKNEHRRAAMVRRARWLSQDWPESLIDSTPLPSTSHDSSSPNTVISMTTNFLIYIPYRIMNQSWWSHQLDRSQVFRNVRLLLLKRSPEANPYPDTWAAVSGRMETDTSTNKLEAPLSAALREIKEETNQDPILFELGTALQPQTIESPNNKQWRVWPLLWRKHFSKQQHDFDLDLAGNLSEPEAMKKVDLLLNRLIRLNHEHVEMSWKGREELGTLTDLVPGLLETFDSALETWIKQENTRYEFERKIRMGKGKNGIASTHSDERN